MSSELQMFHITEGREKGLDAFAKAPADVAVVAERMGFVDVGLWNGRFGRWLRGSCHGRLRKWYARWLLNRRIKRGSVCLFQHPNFSFSCGEFAEILRGLKARDVKVIGLLHDIQELRYNSSGSGLEKGTFDLFQSFDVIIVHNANMRKWMIEHGFSMKKMVDLGAFDYLSKDVQIKKFSKYAPLVIAGNLDSAKAGYLSQLHSIAGVEWNLYGANFNEEKCGCNYYGAFTPEDMPNVLNGSYGVVWDGSSIESCSGSRGEYLQYNNPHKLSLYLRAGMPVIIWNKSAAADFVLKESVGVAVGALSELPRKLFGVDDDAYDKMVARCREISKKIGSGYFVGKALGMACQLLAEC